VNATDTLTVIRDYHDAWTSKDFDHAAGLLSPALVVEVPINRYPTKDSFAEALAGFGNLVKHTEILSEMSAGNEAMLLYDMDVEHLGNLRVVEHFTVENGAIARLRQIHDTAAIRAARFAAAEA
jgi:ketosteroid isomerase-like protein